MSPETWYLFKAVITSTAVNFYLDDTLIGTVTTNIPTVAMREQFVWGKSGTSSTAYTVYLDYVRMYKGLDEAIAAAAAAIGLVIDDCADVDTTTVAPRIGDQMMFDGTNWATFSPRNISYMFEDFTFGSIPTGTLGAWDAWVASGGAVSGSNATDACGIVELSTGVTGAGQAGVARQYEASTAATTGYCTGAGEITYRARIRFRNVQPATTEECFMRVGLADEISGAPLNGIYMATNAGFAADGSGKAKVYLGVRDGTFNQVTPLADFVPTLNEWFLVETIVNAAGTSVSGYVNGVLVGTTSSNIPASSSAMVPAAQMQKSGGSGNIILDVDYIEVIQKVNRE